MSESSFITKLADIIPGRPSVILYLCLAGRSGSFASELLIQAQPVKVHSLKPGVTLNGVVKSPSLAYFFLTADEGAGVSKHAPKMRTFMQICQDFKHYQVILTP